MPADANPVVSINGHRLDSAQVSAMRCALTSMQMNMAEPDALGEDDHGEFMRLAYKRQMDSLLTLFFD